MWDPLVKRYVLTTGSPAKKFTLNLGNFLDFRNGELVRGISFLLNFKVRDLTYGTGFDQGGFFFELSSDYMIRGRIIILSNTILLSIDFPVNIAASSQLLGMC